MRKSISSSNHYAMVGNVVNASVLVASLVYVGAVIHFTKPGNSDVLDDDWKKDGFCIHNKEVHYWSSFDTCLYVDVIFSAVLGVLYWNWRNLPGMKSASEIVPMVILGTLGHGIAHGAMAAKFRDGRYEEDQARDTQETPPFAHVALFCALFWFPLLKAAMPKLNLIIVAILAVVVTYGPTWAGGMKKELGFAYVQTVLSIAFHFSQLALSSEEKQKREYMMLPLTAVVPIITSWSEALLCSSYFKSAGGHVLYDASIILSNIVFYVDCYRVSLLPSTKLASKQKMT